MMKCQKYRFIYIYIYTCTLIHIYPKFTSEWIGPVLHNLFCVFLRSEILRYDPNVVVPVWEPRMRFVVRRGYGS